MPRAQCDSAGLEEKEQNTPLPNSFRGRLIGKVGAVALGETSRSLSILRVIIGGLLHGGVHSGRNKSIWIKSIFSRQFELSAHVNWRESLLVFDRPIVRNHIDQTSRAAESSGLSENFNTEYRETPMKAIMNRIPKIWIPPKCFPEMTSRLLSKHAITLKFPHRVLSQRPIC